MLLTFILFVTIVSSIYGSVDVSTSKNNGKFTKEDWERSASDYYASIDPKAKDLELKTQLHKLINPHTALSYDAVWKAFVGVDKYLPGYPCNANSSYIPDVYSSYCWKTGVTATGAECGNYKTEGDCFNREHLWPKSWFGGFDAGKNCQTDLFELWPSDGYVNGLRGDLPFGIVDRNKITYKSTNGCLIGDCTTEGYSGKCFEAVQNLRGDFARSYFYISVSYMGVWSCCDTAATSKSDIKPWQEKLLRDWHANDPVDDFERARNEEIYANWQHNRNPFIDHPEWVDQISDF